MRYKRLLPVFAALGVCGSIGLSLLFKDSSEEPAYPSGYFTYVYQPPKIDLPELQRVSTEESFDCLKGLDADRLEKVGFCMAGENPAEYLITAKDALVMAQSGQVPASLSESQYRLVLLVAKMQETSLGRDMTANAIAEDIWYCIDNNAMGAASYRDAYGLVSIELTDDSKSDLFRRDFSSEKAFKDNAYDLLSAFYHELTHFYQHRVWKTAEVPEGICSMDKGLWRLSMETQAHLLQKIAADEHRGVYAARDKNSLCRAFVKDTEGNLGHPILYGLEDGKLNDGRRLQLDEYVKAFGFLPDVFGNILEGQFKDMNDLYDKCYSRYSYMHEYYQKALNDIDKPAPFDLSDFLKSSPGP